MRTAARLPATETITIEREADSPGSSQEGLARQGREGRIVRRDPSGWHQIKEHHADGDVDDRDDRHAKNQGPRQVALRVAYLARELAGVPPARKRDEGPDQTDSQGR